MKAFVIEKELNGNHAQLVEGDPKSPAVVDLTLGVGICLAMARNKLHPHDKTRQRGKVVCEQRAESGERRAEVEEQKIDIWNAILR
jgi:hypothetical protein